jgi:hypothetical protein
VVPVGLALDGPTAPFDAVRMGQGDWIAAFLVDELDQGATSLNDPALFPTPVVPASCAGTPDLDTDDQVLFWLPLLDFVSGAAQPVNTGLAGQDRVIVLRAPLAGDSAAIATLESEMRATCDLNEDGDMDDVVARWVETLPGSSPPADPAELRAIANALPGGAMGLSSLRTRLVAAVDEAADSRDIDGKPGDHDLIGWLDPFDGALATWDFDHRGPDTGIGTGIFEDVDGDGIGDPGIGRVEPFAGTSWLSDDSEFNVLPATFLEEVPGSNPRVGSLNTNDRCGLLLKDNDVTDALPTWLDFNRSKTLDFDGVGYAVDRTNAGLVIAVGTVFFRVDEAADSRDYDRDGVLDDIVLMRNPTHFCGPVPMGPVGRQQGPVIVTDGFQGALFLGDETQSGDDFNGDGDSNDLVVRYFLL